jgi:hypothetical protein
MTATMIDAPRRATCAPQEDRLAVYTAADGALREIVLLAAARGSRVLVDRLASDQGDPRLVAHLACDEPDGNAALVVAEYTASEQRACRSLRPDDLREPVTREPVCSITLDSVLVDRRGARYSLAVAGDSSELRWQCELPPGEPRRVSARFVVGAVEDYEPVRSLTVAALERHRRDAGVSVATLGLELRRLETSPIVLNRGLREAVLDAVRRRGMSLSSIALACGRVKLDRRGSRSGETSWLARRVGLMPDAGSRRPNPWVHTDVLALIARDGLGLAPHEVEIG